MDQATLKKIKGQILTEMRVRTGASKVQVDITPREWEAIQAGAISDSKLSRILQNTDIDVIRSYATPRAPKLMTPTRVARAQALLDSGATQAQIADQLGVSLSTLKESLKSPTDSSVTN